MERFRNDGEKPGHMGGQGLRPGRRSECSECHRLGFYSVDNGMLFKFCVWLCFVFRQGQLGRGQ